MQQLEVINDIFQAERGEQNVKMRSFSLLLHQL